MPSNLLHCGILIASRIGPEGYCCLKDVLWRRSTSHPGTSEVANSLPERRLLSLLTTGGHDHHPAHTAVLMSTADN